MVQLRWAVFCIGLGTLVWVFVPREFGGLIGVVTLLVSGCVLAITAPTNRGSNDSSGNETGAGPETSVGRP